MDKASTLKQIVRAISELNPEDCQDDRTKGLKLLLDAYELEHADLFGEVHKEITEEKLRSEREKANAAQALKELGEANWKAFGSMFKVNHAVVNKSIEYDGKKFIPEIVLKPLLIAS